MWILIPYTLALAAALVLQGGVWPRQWNWIALGFGIVTLLWWLTPGGRRQRRTGPDHFELLALLLGVYPLLQLIPLPAELVRLVSPDRHSVAITTARVLEEPAPALIPLSLSPGRTFEVWLMLATAIVVYLSMRRLAARAKGSRWMLAAPIIALCTGQAILGLTQWWLGTASGAMGMATGTYVNRNHFAGFLELGIPLTLGAGAACWWSIDHRLVRPAGTGIKAGLLFVLSAMMVLAVVFSLSRMGFLSALVGIAVAAIALVLRRAPHATAKRRPQLRTGAGIVAAIIALAIILPTEPLVRRFSVFASDDLSPDSRAQIWHDTLSLISVYRWTGCGFGTYESGLYKWKTVAPMNVVDFAHNDYLQLLAELGIPGFALAAALAALILRSAVLSVRQGRDQQELWLASGTLAALVSVALHSLTDFNLYIPANLTATAWLAGLASAHTVAVRRNAGRIQDQDKVRSAHLAGAVAPGPR